MKSFTALKNAICFDKNISLVVAKWANPTGMITINHSVSTVQGGVAI